MSALAALFQFAHPVLINISLVVLEVKNIMRTAGNGNKLPEGENILTFKGKNECFAAGRNKMTGTRD